MNSSKMLDRQKKPSAIATSPGLTPSAQVNFTHSNSRITAVLPTGESIEVLLHGATIASWKDVKGVEKLWLSEAAQLDGSKAVRGGIPLVFPLFGPPLPDHSATANLPQHGFARISRWEFLGKSSSESSSVGASAMDASVKLDFGLSHENLSEESKANWPYPFGLIYSVTLSRDSLETSMLVRNEGTEAFEFQFLMHTYFRINDITKTSISGLDDSKYIDKVANSMQKTETTNNLAITGEIDRVYTPAKGPEHPVIISENGKKLFEIVRDNLDDVVVWNPWADKAAGIADFEPKEGWMNMICVEAGAVKGFQKLEGGDTFEGGQFIKASL